MDSLTVEYIKDILKQEAITVPANFDHIDYSRIIKVYIDTGIEKSETSDKSTIINLLENSSYVWVVPFEVGTKNFQITFGKSGVTEKSSEWKITEVALRTVAPYDQFLTTVNGEYEYSDIILIDGIPAFHMPVALAFDETHAVAWIDMGYSKTAFEDLLGEDKNRNADNVYEYTAVLNAMNSDSNDTVSGFGGGSSSHSHSVAGKLLAFLSIIFLSGGIWIFNKKSREK